MLYVQTGYIIDYAIPVTVENDEISCPNAIISGTKNSPGELEWRMVTGGYEIVNIDFIDQAGKAEFPASAPHHGKPGKEYKLKNKMKNKGPFKYNITVKGTGPLTSKFNKTLDPMVRNEPN